MTQFAIFTFRFNSGRNGSFKDPRPRLVSSFGRYRDGTRFSGLYPFTSPPVLSEPQSFRKGFLFRNLTRTFPFLSFCLPLIVNKSSIIHELYSADGDRIWGKLGVSLGYFRRPLPSPVVCPYWMNDTKWYVMIIAVWVYVVHTRPW